MWEFDGRKRPGFAVEPAAGQESVWDYPRPPRLVEDARHVEVWHGTQRIANTRRAWRVLETASPPTFYLPVEDVAMNVLRAAPGSSFCEWKGSASYFGLASGGEAGQVVAWSYPRPSAPFARIAGCLSFYPGRVRCLVAGELVRPSPAASTRAGSPASSLDPSRASPVLVTGSHMPVIPGSTANAHAGFSRCTENRSCPSHQLWVSCHRDRAASAQNSSMEYL